MGTTAHVLMRVVFLVFLSWTIAPLATASIFSRQQGRYLQSPTSVSGGEQGSRNRRDGYSRSSAYKATSVSSRQGITPEFSISDEFLGPLLAEETVGQHEGNNDDVSHMDALMQEQLAAGDEDFFLDESLLESMEESDGPSQVIEAYVNSAPPRATMPFEERMAVQPPRSTGNRPQPQQKYQETAQDKRFGRSRSNANPTARNNMNQGMGTKLFQLLPAKIRDLKPLFRFESSGPSELNLEVQSSSAGSSSFSRIPGQARTSTWRERDQLTQTTVADQDAAAWSASPQSLLSVLVALVKGSSALGAAFSSTIRLVAPMVFARRVLAYLAYGMSDWYTGRYLRTKYNQLESNYWRYYQVPATLRSLARVLMQGAATMMFGKVLETFLATFYQPWCKLQSGGCNLWCGALWLLCVVGVSHFLGSFIGKSETPLRIHPADERQGKPRDRKRLLKKPWFLLQWLRDPDALIRELASKEGNNNLRPFRPNPMLFPSSWKFVRALQMVAIARHMPSSMASMHSVMFQVCLQEVLRDEWFRVLMMEKRVALGMGVVAFFGLSQLLLFFTVGEVDGASALLLLPSLLAALVSTWMNIFVYFERRSKRPIIQGQPTTVELQRKIV